MIFIFEGPDRVGKDTQIKLLKCQFPGLFFHELHYTADIVKNIKDSDISLQYSKKYYNKMFGLITNSDENFILNRSHIGEFVYGPMYRNYNGEYVFEFEKKYNLQNRKDIYLIVLIDEPINLINREDGKSHSKNLESKTIEIYKFKLAYDLSCIKHKILININNKTPEKIFNEICDFKSYANFLNMNKVIIDDNLKEIYND